MKTELTVEKIEAQIQQLTAKDLKNKDLLSDIKKHLIAQLRDAANKYQETRTLMQAIFGEDDALDMNHGGEKIMDEQLEEVRCPKCREGVFFNALEPFMYEDESECEVTCDFCELVFTVVSVMSFKFEAKEED